MIRLHLTELDFLLSSARGCSIEAVCCSHLLPARHSQLKGLSHHVCPEVGAVLLNPPPEKELARPSGFCKVCITESGLERLFAPVVRRDFRTRIIAHRYRERQWLPVNRLLQDPYVEAVLIVVVRLPGQVVVQLVPDEAPARLQVSLNAVTHLFQVFPRVGVVEEMDPGHDLKVAQPVQRSCVPHHVLHSEPLYLFLRSRCTDHLAG